MYRIISLLVFTILPFSLLAESIVVQTTVNSKTTTLSLMVMRSEENGLTWEEISGKDGTTKFGYSETGALKAVELQNQEGKWSLRQDGDVLTMTGETKGKPVNGSLTLKGRIWAIGLDHPVNWATKHSLKSEMPFLIITPAKFTEVAELVLTHEGLETIEGKKAIRYKLGLPGAMSLLWSAKIWADPISGDLFLFKGNQGPGTAEITIATKRQP